MVKTTLILAAALVLVVATILSLVDGRHVGVCNGLEGSNLPPPSQVIDLYKRSGIEMLRIYQNVPEVLDALRGSGLSVAVGLKNEELQNLAASPDAAAAWVNTNIAPYRNDVQFKWITLRNEVNPGPLATYVAPAMNNVRNALTSIGLNGIKVTTVLPSNALSASFDSCITGIMSDLASFLVQDGAPRMLNLYPYFPYSSDPDHISLDYALFKATSPTVVDGGLNYFNLVDAMVDSFNAALKKINYGNVALAISESGIRMANDRKCPTRKH